MHGRAQCRADCRHPATDRSRVRQTGSNNGLMVLHVFKPVAVSLVSFCGIGYTVREEVVVTDLCPDNWPHCVATRLLSCALPTLPAGVGQTRLPEITARTLSLRRDAASHA